MPEQMLQVTRGDNVLLETHLNEGEVVSLAKAKKDQAPVVVVVTLEPAKPKPARKRVSKPAAKVTKTKKRVSKAKK